MTSAPLISVVVPTYKRPTFLERSIGSIAKQTHTHWEIIVVDDNDSRSEHRSETERFMTRYADDVRIRYIKHEQNQGGAAARNTGIEVARGEYVAFLDDDDEWLASKLEKQLAVFLQYPECVAVYTGYKSVHEGGKPDQVALPKLRGAILEDLLYKNSVGTTSTVMCKRDALLEVNAFDAALPASQDYDLYIRLAQLGTFEYVDEVLVIFHRHMQEKITDNNPARIEAFDLFCQKHSDLFQRYPKAYQHHLKVFGRYFLTVGEVKKADEVLRRALKLEPSDLKVWSYLVLANLGERATKRVQETRKAVRSLTDR